MLITNIITSIKVFIKVYISDFCKTLQALILKFKYQQTLNRLKSIYGKKKIIVAFGVSEIAKWKSQSLYNKLEKTNSYLPIIFIYPSPLELNQETNKIDLLLKEKINFFRSKKITVLNIWDNVSNKCIIPSEFYPDILFYQQPWDIPPFLPPTKTANYALSFYIPYYLINNFDINIEFGHPLHHQVFGYIVQNEQAAKFYTSLLVKRNYAGNCLGLGHTIVDSLTSNIELNKIKNSVIYAPHFSFPIVGKNRILTYSTFLENGKLILEFAKQHPEIKWIFKPHPRLRLELKNTRVWTDTEINTYYEEWAKIGIVCTTSDYAEHFHNSFAMITDCGSFLTEYSCMNKPLIRLYYYKDSLPPNPILDKLYKTFYYAHNNEELINLLEEIICKRKDPNKNERNKEVTSLRLNQSNSAQKIIDYLDKLLSSRKVKE